MRMVACAAPWLIGVGRVRVVACVAPWLRGAVSLHAHEHTCTRTCIHTPIRACSSRQGITSTHQQEKALDKTQRVTLWAVFSPLLLCWSWMRCPKL